MPDVKQTSSSNPSPVYQIRVEGYLDTCWSSWFDDLTVACDSDSAARPITTLTGPVPDQAALRGILCRLWDLGLTVTFVIRLAAAESRLTASQPEQ